jgi:hypothetical protein
MDIARPAQRQIQARILTGPGWILGTFHVPEKQGFVEFLNGEGHFYTLTEVTLPGSTKPLPFFAMSRAAAVLIVPGADDNLSEEESQEGGREARLSCLLEEGLLMGAIDLPAKTRVSDYLMQSNRHFLIKNCTIGIEGRLARTLDSPQGSGPSVHAAPRAIIHGGRVVGVAEM